MVAVYQYMNVVIIDTSSTNSLLNVKSKVSAQCSNTGLIEAENVKTEITVTNKVLNPCNSMTNVSLTVVIGKKLVQLK